jgi:phosphoenolpyruvate---glycerone phosphotransferase subunit DhaL
MATRDEIVNWLEKLAEVVTANKEYLTELDSAIGDADHGINMKRGIDRVMEKLPSVADKDIGNILKTAGMTLISSVGGASGPLYGTFFMRGGMAAAAKEELTADDLLEVLQAGVDGIVQRGRAQPGDKTMVDAWLPALAAYRSRARRWRGRNHCPERCGGCRGARDGRRPFPCRPAKGAPATWGSAASATRIPAPPAATSY